MTVNRIAVIVEGETFEGNIVKSIKSNFFNARLGLVNYTLINLPSAMNIYMLWNQIKDDEFADIIEVVRERTKESENNLEGLTRDSFSEIYLFFDYDKHQNNAGKDVIGDDVVMEMLETFDNETEQGKLYISYPMAEALRDFIPGSCCTFTKQCHFSKGTSSYKTVSGNSNPNADFKKYTVNRWADALNCYLGRLSCLFESESLFDFARAKEKSAIDIFKKQIEMTKTDNQSLIVSAFPEFLIDYFREDCLKELFSFRSFVYSRCVFSGRGEFKHSFANQ